MNDKDLAQIAQRGSSESAVEKQIGCFKKGFPWMKIVGPATPERGIVVLGDEKVKEAVKYVETAEFDGACKFVPASGAASRMFKDMFSGLSRLEGGEDVAPDSPAAKLVSNIEKFAFYSEDLFGGKEDTPEYRKKVLSLLLGP